LKLRTLLKEYLGSHELNYQLVECESDFLSHRCEDKNSIQTMLFSVSKVRILSVQMRSVVRGYTKLDHVKKEDIRKEMGVQPVQNK